MALYLRSVAPDTCSGGTEKLPSPVIVKKVVRLRHLWQLRWHLQPQSGRSLCLFSVQPI